MSAGWWLKAHFWSLGGGVVLNSATFPRESEMFQQCPALAEKLLRPKLFHLYGLSTPLTFRLYRLYGLSTSLTLQTFDSSDFPTLQTLWTLWTLRTFDSSDFKDFMDFMDFTDFKDFRLPRLTPPATPSQLQIVFSRRRGEL